jgi:hypothetical protein
MSTAITGKGSLCIDLVGSATHAAGEAIGSILNPCGHAIIITDAVVYSTANSTGAANITVGQGASVTAGHDSATIVAAAALAAAKDTAIQGFDHADAADSMVVLGTSEYIVACGSASTVGYAGRLHIKYIHA